MLHIRSRWFQRRREGFFEENLLENLKPATFQLVILPKITFKSLLAKTYINSPTEKIKLYGHIKTNPR